MLKGTRKTEIELKERKNRMRGGWVHAENKEKTEIELKERENRMRRGCREQGSEEKCSKCETCFSSLEITENTHVQPVELLRKINLHSHPPQENWKYCTLTQQTFFFNKRALPLLG